MGVRLAATFDAEDPVRLAAFWALALGYTEPAPPRGFDSWQAHDEAVGLPTDLCGNRLLTDPRGHGPKLYFQRVPERKRAKNRLHFDLEVGDGADVSETEWRAQVDPFVERLVQAGGSVLHLHHDVFDRYVVMSDPEGNEFCVC